MKIIKFLKEKEKKDKAYEKEIHEVQKKYGKYRSKPKRFIVELCFLASLVLVIATIMPVYSFQKILQQNNYIVNIEQSEHRMLSEFDKASSCDQIDNDLQKRECFIKLMGEDELELYITNIAVVIYANVYIKENNDIVLAKAILDKLKELQISRHYDDLNADVSTDIAFDIIGESLFGKIIHLLMDSEIKINEINLVENKIKMATDLEKEIRKKYNLEDYEAVIR
jgi:hypothetical protein